MKKTVIILLIITLALTPSGCTIKEPDGSDQRAERISVYTTLYVLEEFATRIGGERVEAVNLIPAGVSPHDYEPSARDIAAVVDSDLFIYNGAGMELWINKVLTNLVDTKVSTLNASENAHLIITDISKNSSSYDPHTWLSLSNAIIIARDIRDALIQLDSESEKYFQENYELLEAELIELDERFKKELANLERTDFYISHAAFSYIADSYNLKQHSISGFTPEDEPSLGELQQISASLTGQSIKYILVDPTESTKIADVLATELGLDTIEIYTIGSLNPKQKAEGLNYYKLMELNLLALTKALTE